MINLLPQKEKQDLLFLKNRNLVIVLGSITIIFLICLGLVFLSLKFYILQKVSFGKSILEDTESEYQTDNFLSILDSIKQYNKVLSRADSFYKKQVYFSNALREIVEIQRPQNVKFESIILEKVNADNKIKANIYGVSYNRDALLLFKGNVEQQERIVNVYIPPDNLVKPTNINFSLSFEISTGQ